MSEIDGRCMCDRCEARTQAVYRLHVTCNNCGARHTILMRKGDRPSPSSECPDCGVSQLTFGSLVIS